MVVRVAQRAALARHVDRVLVASGDDAILQAAQAHGVLTATTPRDMPSGTHRVAWAMSRLDERPRIVVNVQGDEPFIEPDHIDALVDALDSGALIATLAAPMTDGVRDRQRVKVRWDQNGDAVAFSRCPMEPPHWQHLGVYGFLPDTLEQLVCLPETASERLERLEQLRWLEHGHAIRVVPVGRAGLSVDTPEDLGRARAALRAAP